MMEQAKTVRFWDRQSDRIVEIPATELPEGAILARVNGIEGEVWLAPENLQMGPIQHGPFDDDVRELIREIQQAFAEHYPLTLEQWEEGFRRDSNPVTEIALWLRAAETYRPFARIEANADRRRDIFRCIIGCMNTTPETVWLQLRPKLLSRSEAQRIIDVYYGEA